MSDLTLMLVQADLVWENPDRNRLLLGSLINQGGKADLIVLPEMFTTGFTMSPAAFAENPGGETEEWMIELASETGACIVGSYVVKEDEKFFNRMLAVNSKGVMLTYDKRHLFRMGNEHEVYSAGKRISTFMLKGWRICPLVCYDLRFPVWSRNRLKANSIPSYDLLLYSANWPSARIQHWKTLLQARAIENQAFVAGVNRAGVDGNGIYHTGDSCVISPQGTVLSSCAHMESVLKKTISLDSLTEYREKFPAWMDGDSFAIAL